MKRFFLILGVILVLIGILTDTTHSASPPRRHYISIFRELDIEIQGVFMSAPDITYTPSTPGNRLRKTITDAGFTWSSPLSFAN